MGILIADLRLFPDDAHAGARNVRNDKIEAPAERFIRLGSVHRRGANDGKTESYFFTDAEYEANKNKVKGEVQRNKGLGSLEPDQARKSMFDPEYQRMDVIEYDEEAIDLLYSLMGSEVEPRRDFIMQNVDFSKIRE